MNLLNPYRFQDLPEPNIFFGGVGATTITTKEELANQFTLSSSDILNFQIDANNNVSCFFNVTTSFQGPSFLGNTELTYIIDVGGSILSVNGFNVLNNCTNLEYLYLPSANFNAGSQTGFTNLNSLIRLSCDAATLFEIRTMNAPLLEKVLLPNVTEITPFSNMNIGSGVKIFNAPALTNLSRANSEVVDDIRILESTTNAEVFVNSALGVTDRNAFGWVLFGGGNFAAGDTFDVNGLTYTGVNGTPSVDGEFDINTSWRGVSGLRDAINADTRTGTVGSVIATNDFGDLGLRSDIVGTGGNAVTYGNLVSSTVTILGDSGGTLLYGNDYFQELVKLREARGATLTTVNQINQSPPSNLGVVNLGGNEIGIAFEPANPNLNGLKGYEVWIDDGTIYRKWFYYADITAPGDTLILNDVASDVGTIVGALVKIRAIDNHYNFSVFTQEVAIPDVQTANTFIGAIVNDTINSEADIATLTGLTVNEVYLYNKDVNGNIQYLAPRNYIMQSNNVILNGQGYGYYVDLDGLVTNLAQNSMVGAANSSPNNPTTHYMPNVSAISGFSLRRSSSKFWDFPLISGGSASDSFTQSDVRWFRVGVATNMSNLGQFFVLERYYLPNWSPPNATVINGFFDSILATGWTVYVDDFHLTSNAGGLDATLADAVATDGATVVGIANKTSPNPVTNLAATNITATTVDLTFTAPSSLNTLDFYEVWIENTDLDLWSKERVEGRYNIDQEITASGDTVTGLTTATNYNIHVVACDIYWNRSAISNIISITTL